MVHAAVLHVHRILVRRLHGLSVLLLLLLLALQLATAAVDADGILRSAVAVLGRLVLRCRARTAATAVLSGALLVFVNGAAAAIRRCVDRRE